VAFAVSCSQHARKFLCRLYSGLSQATREGIGYVTPEIRKDILWLIHFLPRYNGIHFVENYTNFSKVLYSDSSLIGSAGQSDNWVFYFDHSKISGMCNHITEFEAFAVLVTLRVFTRGLKDQKLLFYCDNQAVVSCYNNSKVKNVFIQGVMREIWFLLAVNNLQLVMRYIKSSDNVICDAISRSQISLSDKLKSDQIVVQNNLSFVNLSNDVLSPPVDV